jgi:hypothetical protein
MPLPPALRAATVGALVTGLAAGMPADVHGQGRPLNVIPRQPLTFGTIWSGQPAHVSALDPVRSGQIELRGIRLTEVQITFTLPAALAGPSGAQLPLTFGSGDGAMSASGTIGSATPFDPRSPVTGQLSGNGRLSLYLGATAQPALRQPAGAYSGTITVTIAYTGT